MTEIVDRRKGNDDDTIINRRRFLERSKKHIRRAVEKSIGEGSIKDIGKGGTDVNVPRDTLKQPTIHNGQGGNVKRVYPWNKRFQKGDQIKKQGGGGGGQGDGGQPGDASDQGEGEDDFTFHINEKEFLDYIFDDLELPDLIKRNEEKATEVRNKNAGFTTSGNPSRLSVEESFKKKKKRTMVTDKKRSNRIIELLEESKGIYKSYDTANDEEEKSDNGQWKPRKAIIKELEDEVETLKGKFNKVVNDDHAKRLVEIDDEIASIGRSKKITDTWREEIDLKYRAVKQEKIPSTNAVMFCLMDVSGSMDEQKKNNSKVFYFMLYQFLKRNYEHTDIVFIRHHTEAEEVDEQEFFYGRETGGTIVSSALVKMQEVLDERYSGGGWNIYAAQASDGDNFSSDNAKTEELLGKLVKQVQAYFYTEVRGGWTGNRKSDIWDVYESVRNKNPGKFYMGKIEERNDVLKVFRDFFKKKSGPSLSSDKAAAFKP